METVKEGEEGWKFLLIIYPPPTRICRVFSLNWDKINDFLSKKYQGGAVVGIFLLTKLLKLQKKDE